MRHSAQAWCLLERLVLMQTSGSSSCWPHDSIARAQRCACIPLCTSSSASTSHSQHNRRKLSLQQCYSPGLPAACLGSHGSLQCSLGMMVPWQCHGFQQSLTPSVAVLSANVAGLPSVNPGSASALVHCRPTFHQKSQASSVVMISRSFSAQADGHKNSSPAADLKTALRRLYMRVHPDMCGENMEARAENERSFKLLQEYLGKARSTTGDSRDSLFPQLTRAYRFVFYLRDQPESDEGEENTADTTQAAAPCAQPAPGSPEAKNASGATGPKNAAKFRRVEVSLNPPPPAPPSPAPRKGDDTSAEPGVRLHPEARSGLTRLMQVCGIQVAFSEEWMEAEATGMANQRLSVFLPGAVEALRRAEAGGVTEGVRAATIRGALRLQRKVLVSFPKGEQLPPGVQVAALQALVRLLESPPVRSLDLSGCSILMGRGPGIDRMGNLLLDLGPLGVLSSAPPEAAATRLSYLEHEWRDLLLGVDLEFVKARKAYVQAVRELEGGVAESLGVAAIFGSNPQNLIAEPSYREFLERLAAAAAERGPIVSRPGAPLQDQGQPAEKGPRGSAAQHEQQQAAKGKGLPFQAVALSVWSEYAFTSSLHQDKQQQQQQQQQQQPTTGVVDEELGALRVHDGLNAEQVYATVVELGDKARAAMARNRDRDAGIGRLVDRVRRTLRLRRLMRDERLAVHHFQAACLALLEQADALAHTLEGSSVRISFTNRLAPDGSYIDIAYNFRP